MNTPGRKDKNTLTSRLAIFRGKRQYPSKQMHCIIERFPPKSFVFIVMIIDPIQIITNTVVNTNPESFFDVIERILFLILFTYSPRNKHITKGPHRSHCFNSFTFSSLTYGTTTTRIFKYIRFKSLSWINFILLSCPKQIHVMCFDLFLPMSRKTTWVVYNTSSLRMLFILFPKFSSLWINFSLKLKSCIYY